MDMKPPDLPQVALVQGLRNREPFFFLVFFCFFFRLPTPVAKEQNTNESTFLKTKKTKLHVALSQAPQNHKSPLLAKPRCHSCKNTEGFYINQES